MYGLYGEWDSVPITRLLIIIFALPLLIFASITKINEVKFYSLMFVSK